MKDFIKNTPVIRTIAKSMYFFMSKTFTTFAGSRNYWDKRYQEGRNSGLGSYGKLAEFKADILNSFVRDNGIESVIEYGCGDGNQLNLSEYSSYIGFDVSHNAICRCRKLFENDSSKAFKLVTEYSGERADLTLSLDVIYHLIEDDIYHGYMKCLFESSNKFVIIYSSNTSVQEKLQPEHVKHREFTSWIDKYAPAWELLQHIPNKYPYSGNDLDGSFADFYIYKLLNNN